MTSSRCTSQKQHIDKMIDVTARLDRCDLTRREHSGGQNNQDEGEEKQLLNNPGESTVTNRTEIQQIQDSFCADRFQLSKPSRKPWRFTKLQFIDISVNVQKSIPTVRVPHVQHKDKHPMRTVQEAEEESYSVFDWDS